MSRPGLSIAFLIAVLSTSCAMKRAADMPSAEQSISPTRNRDAGREVMKTASLEVVVESVPNAVDQAGRIVKDAGGYVPDSVTSKDAAARLNLRVPAARLSDVLDRLAALGSEARRQVSSEDVTETLHDLEAELANKKALRDRLRALLTRAKDVKDVLSVESELTRLQTDIDALEGRRKRMREDVALSAIELTLTPREAVKKTRILGPLGYLYVGTKWIVTKLFVIRP